jgi:hypothetical protein
MGHFLVFPINAVVFNLNNPNFILICLMAFLMYVVWASLDLSRSLLRCLCSQSCMANSLPVSPLLFVTFTRYGVCFNVRMEHPVSETCL